MTGYKNSSPYSKTPVRSLYITYLDLHNPKPIASAPDDDEIIITSKYELRPDLLSNDLYGTPDLWWIFALRNPDVIKDPVFDMRSDRTIFVPSRSRAFSLLGQ